MSTSFTVELNDDTWERVASNLEVIGQQKIAENIRYQIELQQAWRRGEEGDSRNEERIANVG